MPSPSYMSAASGVSAEQIIQQERDRLYALMLAHVATLPLDKRLAWIEPMSVVRRGRFLTDKEKLDNLAKWMAWDRDEFTRKFSEDPGILRDTEDQP